MNLIDFKGKWVKVIYKDGDIVTGFAQWWNSKEDEDDSDGRVCYDSLTLTYSSLSHIEYLRAYENEIVSIEIIEKPKDR